MPQKQRHKPKQQQQQQQMLKYQNNWWFYWIFSTHTEFIHRDVLCSFSHSQMLKQNSWLEVGCESPFDWGLIRACAKRTAVIWFFGLVSFVNASTVDATTASSVHLLSSNHHTHTHTHTKFAVRIPMMFVWCSIKIAFQKFRRFHAYSAQVQP